MKNKNQFFIGKVKDYQKGKGWFFGQFMDEGLLQSDLVEIAWENISNKKPETKDKHYHKNSVEINIVISGWVKIGINSKIYQIEKGGFFNIYPYTIVESVETGPETAVICIRAPSVKKDKFIL